MIGNKIKLNEEHFKALVEQTRFMEDDLNSCFVNSFKSIEADLEKTFPELHVFDHGTEMHIRLKNVLCAFT